MICMIEKGRNSPFLFPKKFVNIFTKKFRRSDSEDCERFHKKIRRTVLVNIFTKKLDECRLKNIFLDFSRNLVYTLGILKKKRGF